ncbi:DUF6550 family protein [Enterocloster bolteae]|uniref:DUF6550 family protein n=1 Tax=Enterocloster bolteae TaxID=208479 RepID=UPI002A7FCFB7|nr:DUF6550 family protein [Enterocloster bolteae]
MKRNEQMKRRLAVLGCVVVGAVLIAAIVSQFRGEEQGSNQVEEQTKQTEAVTVAVIPTETTEAATEEETETIKPDIVVKTEPATEPSRTRPSETAAALPAQTDRTEQAVQPAPEKPAAPPEEVLKDPTQKPDGESVEGTPEAIPHEEVVQPSEIPTQAGEPQYGDTQNGKIYVPGFGWIDEIGEAQGTVAEDMYENGNKIGIMD